MKQRKIHQPKLKPSLDSFGMGFPCYTTLKVRPAEVVIVCFKNVVDSYMPF